MMNSIFSLSSKKDELHLTKVFSFLLNSDRKLCEYLIKNIFKAEDSGEVLHVRPEEQVESEKPDITIKCRNNKIAIENKIDGKFTPDQIQRYKGHFKYVYLIYRNLSDSKQASFADNYFSWHEIYSCISNYIKKLDDGYDLVNKYLLHEFIKFLRENNMAVEKVEKELIKGVKSLCNLISQIEEALKMLKKQEQIVAYGFSSRGAKWKGWVIDLIEDDSFEIYIYYSPISIYTCFKDEKNDSNYHPKLESKLSFLGIWENYWFIQEMNIEKSDFLSLSVNDQIASISDFIISSKEEYLP